MAKTQKVPKHVKIIVDHRETKNHVFRNLQDLDVSLLCKQLKIGDYICSDRVALERKTIPDFIQSVIDGRIFKQVREISECFERPVLIIEGNPDLLFFERNIHPNTIRGALASLVVDHKIPILWSRNSNETAHQIYWIAQREQIQEKRSVAVRCFKKAKTISEQQEFLIAGLPYVNTKLSRNLLKKFKTPKRVFTAKPDKLMKVEGIGKGKARRIWEVLNRTYGD